MKTCIFKQIDLSFSYISSIEGLKLNLTNLKFLVLERTLLARWSYLLHIVELCPQLETLNLSDNRFFFDEDFVPDVDYSSSKLTTLILNKCNLNINDLFRLAPVFASLKQLYLFSNNINEASAEPIPQKLLSNLQVLSLEKNNITGFGPIYQSLGRPQLKNLNLNDNNMRRFEVTSQELVDSLIYLLIDHNDLEKEVLKDMQPYQKLKDIHITNNRLWNKKTKDALNIELIGRLGGLKNLNSTFITRDDRRDSEILYLKGMVKEYFDTLKDINEFNLTDFEKHMTLHHIRYFVLKTKYFDPVEEFLENGLKSQKANLKSTILTFKFTKEGTEIEKKFPKTISFNNLRNVLCRLFKSNSNFKFVIENGEFPLEVTDETQSLEYYNVREVDTINLVAN